MTILAVKLAFLRLVDPAHERLAERFSVVRVARHANRGTDNCGFDGSTSFRSPCDRAFRCWGSR